MERWTSHLGAMAEDPAVDAFVEDVIAVCRRHGLSISHEDDHGAFLIVPFNELDADRLWGAFDDRAAPDGAREAGDE